MTQADISLHTRQAMASSLKNFMGVKPLSKITVSEICQDCGLNRKTFYYHFEDIYSLLHWMLEQGALGVFKKFNLLTDYKKAICFLMDYIDANKHILNCVYDAMGREGMKQFFLSDFQVSLNAIIEGMEKDMDIHADQGYKQFLCEFYTNALAGILTDWFRDRDVRTREEMIHHILLTIKTSLRSALWESCKN